MSTLVQRIESNALCPHINIAARDLSRAFGDSIPSDFEWWLTLGHAEIAAGWAWKNDPDRGHQREVRADSPEKLLALWLAVDWRAERREAKDAANCA
jgi:hypothetical protein